MCYWAALYIAMNAVYNDSCLMCGDCAVHKMSVVAAIVVAVSTYAVHDLKVHNTRESRETITLPELPEDD